MRRWGWLLAVIATASTHANNTDWPLTGRTYDEQRFSPLEQINPDTVSRLGLSWSFDLETTAGQEATPIVADGVMYVASAFSVVKALDARTGRLLWSYDPHTKPWLVHACCGPVSRGVALWKSRVYVGALDGRLIALDAASGHVIWQTQTFDHDGNYSITGAPRIVKGKVIIGNGGADMGARGYVSAYDADSGKLAWRFYTVPGKPGESDHAASDAILASKAAITWNGSWWKYGGGGTVWDSMAYDPDLDLLYVGTGNGSPWNQSIRSPGGGDNLFLSSILALRPDTGEYVWHYQETPGESWDYTATQHIVLADIPLRGHARKVLLHAPKNGFFYVLDRAHGELISAQPFVHVSWASSVDPKTGRPIESPSARYYSSARPALQFPGPGGGHNWPPMSFDPRTGLVYIPAQDSGFLYTEDTDSRVRMRGNLTGVSLDGGPRLSAADKATVMSSMRGYLVAWNPAEQKAVWRVEQRAPFNGAVLSTAGGLVFEGDLERNFAAYRADNGQKVWSFPAQVAVVASPVAFELDGKEYVAVLAGWGGVWPISGGEFALKTGDGNGPNRVLVFELDGHATLPPPPPKHAAALQPPSDTSSPEHLAQGTALFGHFCARCHGVAAISAGWTPDLRHSAWLNSGDAWLRVVRGGALSSEGMASFSKDLTVDEALDIRAYVIHRATEDKAEE